MNFSSYDKYIDSNIEWLGKVPAHWDLAKLKHQCRFKGGGTPDKDNNDYWNGDIPWVSPKDMKVGLLEATVDTITQKALSETATTVVKAGAVLIVVRSGILQHSIPVAINTVDVTLNQDMKALIPSRGLSSKYLKRLIEGNQINLLLKWSKQGATVESLEQEFLSNTVLPIPPREEQTAIVNFLDRETAKIDALIDKQEQLVKLLEEKRLAMISHAVTKGLNPDVRMKDSGVKWLGEVPEHWDEIKFRWLYRFSKRQNYPDLEVLSVYRDHGVVVKAERDGNANKTPEDVTSYQLVEVGDLVVNKMKAWQGSLGVSPHKGITSPDYMVFVPTHSESNGFVHFMLRAKHMTGVYRSISNGIRPSQWRIEPDKLKQLPVFLPPLAEQKEISEWIHSETEHSGDLIQKSRRAIALLQERRTALISAAVTGKIDVRNAV